MHNLQVKRLGKALGAELSGVDLAAPLADETIAQIRAALLAHGVIFFREQQLSAAKLLRLARYFGEPARYPFVDGNEFPEVVEVRKEATETINFGGLWHTDTSYLEQPPLGSILYAVEVPPTGGDTLFSCMTSACRALSPQLQDKLRGARGINSSRKSAAAQTRVARSQDNPGASHDDTFIASHPIIRTHPETAQQSLYCSDAHTIGIEGMQASESEAILQQVYQLQQRPEFIYRFSWQPGSVAFWDNRCTQHNALNDYQGYRRVMLRVTIKGDTPV